jgi:exodeoxyribonuclease III
MRILAVNVQAGGINAKIDALLERALGHEADIYVLSEFRDSPTGVHIRETLEQSGYPRQTYSRGHRGNGVLVAACEIFEPVHNPAGLPEDGYPNAMIECVFADMHVIGVYLPGQDRKRPHLDYLIRLTQAMDEQNIPAVIVGDFNSGRNETDIEANLGKKRLVDEFSTAEQYRLLEQQWHEAWLYKHPGEVEFSWYPRTGPPLRKNGWRLDKAFVSRALLPRVRDVFYDHGFRLEGLTDHSALIVDLD